MLVSIFTPSHDPRWLDEALQSVLSQTYQDWEWVVLLNGGATWSPRVSDGRVKVHTTGKLRGVGEAKRRNVELCSGAVLVELDHDDLLLPNALEAVVAALVRQPDQRFVYSDWAEISLDGGRHDGRFDPAHGWRYSDFPMGDQVVDRCHALAASPRNMSLIWYEPNHLRAFTRDLYDEVGGYDATLKVLDDQNLMCRMYERSAFTHIDQCLYLQRRHPANTQSEQKVNAHIQKETVVLAQLWLERLALAWTARQGLAALDLASGAPRAGYVSPNGSSVWMPKRGSELHLDLADSSVGVLRAYEVLQLFSDKTASLDEVHRVLVHGGVASIWLPSSDGRGAFQDPRHVSYWNEHSFWYVTDEAYRHFVPETTARFQVARLETVFPDDWYRERNISYVAADLIAIKEGPRQGGLLKV